MKSFAELFKKYRLRAEFDTISAFSETLAQHGYFYDESIFSHWQKGTRVPNNRKLVLTLIKTFEEKGALNSIEEANELLDSLHLGYLTKNELNEFPKLVSKKTVIFQVPREIEDFIGRENLLTDIKTNIKLGKVIHIYGSPGTGKTALAIKVAHLLHQEFPDGILWYRMDNTSIKDVLISLGHLLQINLPNSNNVEILASCIRVVLSQRKVLIIFDNVEVDSKLHFLLPNSLPSSLVILSRQKNLYLPAELQSISLGSFNNSEVLKLFEKIFGQGYISKNKRIILELSKIVGDMPLALHLIASQLKETKQTPKDILKQLYDEELNLKSFSYEDKNLFKAINVSFKNLSKKAQAVFLSLSAWEGKDFYVEEIAYMNGLSVREATIILDELYNASLIEFSLSDRFRIHPMIKKFIGEKINNPYLSIIVKIALLLFGGLTVLWLIIQTKLLSWDYNEFFGAVYFVVPLWGTLWGFSISRKWGGIKSPMGRVVFIFSLGLLLQTLGQVIYTFYITVVRDAIPYPSWGDVGYFGSMTLYIYGVFHLSKLSTVKIGFDKLKRYFTVLCAYLVLILLAFKILLEHYIFSLSNAFKIVLDFSYILGDSIFLLLIVILYLELRRENKNIMANKVFFFVIALAIQCFADFVFVYQANLETFRVGQINDFIYLVAYLLMTLAIIKLNEHLPEKGKN